MDNYYDKNKRIQLRVSQEDIDRITALQKHRSEGQWYVKAGVSASILDAIKFYCEHHELKIKE